MNPRTTRQARLPEVGAEGNARLAAASVALACTGAAAVYERCYLEGAGVQVIDAADANCEPKTRVETSVPPDLHPAAQALWDGADAALGRILAELNLR